MSYNQFIQITTKVTLLIFLANITYAGKVPVSLLFVAQRPRINLMGDTHGSGRQDEPEEQRQGVSRTELETSVSDTQHVARRDSEESEGWSGFISTSGMSRQIVMVTANWCGYCQVWKRDVEPKLRLAGWGMSMEASAKHIRLMDVDSLPQRFRPDTLPTFYVTDTKGNIIRRHTGYADGHALLKLWNQTNEQTSDSRVKRAGAEVHGIPDRSAAPVLDGLFGWLPFEMRGRRPG